MTPQAYLYICDGDIDHPVLTHKKMDWSEKYPHWQEIPLVMAQKTKPVAWMYREPDNKYGLVHVDEYDYAQMPERDEWFPVYTSPMPRQWANMTTDEVDQGLLQTGLAMKTAQAWRHGVEWAQFNLMRKNT